MATFKTNQTSNDFEEYIRDLLECPVCKETIKSVPVYQCNNGHVICNECIRQATSCPICRDNSKPARSLKLEKIVQRLEGIPPENGGPTTVKPNIQKWGMESVRSYGTINGPNQEPHIEIPLSQAPFHQVAVNQDEEVPLLQRELENRQARDTFCVMLACLLFVIFLIFCCTVKFN